MEYPHFTLGQWSSIRLRLLWAYERTLSPQQDAGAHDYRFQSAILVRQGWLEVKTPGGETLRATRGQWLVFPEGLRRQQWSRRCRLMSIGFCFQVPTGEPVLGHGLPWRGRGETVAGLTGKGERVLAVMRERIGLGYFPEGLDVALPDYLASQSCFGDFFLELVTVLAASGIGGGYADMNQGLVQRVMEKLDGVSFDGRLSAKALSRQVGYSAAYLDRLLVTHTGRTLHRHLQERRLAKAREALQWETIPIKAIAHRLGFVSPSHFGAWFKMQTGQTPRQFRKA